MFPRNTPLFYHNNWGG